MTKRNVYLERMPISEVRMLAVALGLTAEELLQASLSLSQNIADLKVEGLGDLPQVHNPQVTVTA